MHYRIKNEGGVTLVVEPHAKRQLSQSIHILETKAWVTNEEGGE